MLTNRSQGPQQHLRNTLMALLLTASLLLLLTACGSDSSSPGSDDRQSTTLIAVKADTTTVSTAPVSTTTTPRPTTMANTPTTSVPGPITGFDLRSIIRQIAVADDRAVAVGSACEGPGDDRGLCVAAIWTTTDTESWQRIVLDAAVLGEAKGFEGAFHLTDIAVSEAGFVAVASTGSTALFSPDGLTWALIPGLEGSRLRRVVAADAGFLAAGDGIWHSEDGWTWHPLDEPHPSSVAHIAAGPDRIVVFTGSDVWTSMSGESWEVWDRAIGAEPSAPTSTCLGGPRPTQVGRLLGTPDGFLVTQSSKIWTEGQGAVWTSSDAIVWNRTELPETDDENATITAVAVGEHHYLAFGITWHLPDSDDGGCPDVVVTDSVAWISSDAQTWTLLDQPELDSERPTGAWFYKDRVLMTFGSRNRIVTWDPPASDVE
jgi:hypothetical protein